MLIRKSSLAALFIAFCLATLSGRASTLQLVNSGGETYGNQTVYPYNFSVNGSSALTSLICLDLNRIVTFGEVWNVYITGIPLDSSASSTGYRTDAWIFSQLGKTASNGSTYSDSDVQLAVWDIFDPTDASNLGLSKNAMELVASGRNAAVNSALLKSGFFSQFTLYTPTDNNPTDYATGSIPQRFIGASAVTPEPSSLMLLGTGLLSAGSIALRRRSGLV